MGSKSGPFHSRALFAASCGGLIPEVADEGALTLDEVRHPLLDRQLRVESARCVPLRLELGPDASATPGERI